LKTIGFASKEIETAFKEELNVKRSDIYEIYSTTVSKIFQFGKERTMILYKPGK